MFCFQDEPSTSTSTGDRFFRVGGRERPTVLKGRQSKAERKLQADELKAQALYMLACGAAKKKTSSKPHCKMPLETTSAEEDSPDEY